MDGLETGATDWWVSRELKRLRAANGYSLEEVAANLGWLPSKLVFVESGSSLSTESDLRQLLGYYVGADSPQILETIGRGNDPSVPMFRSFKESVDPSTLRYFELESRASHIRQYEPLLVPGLLQTESYTRHIMGSVYGYTLEHIDATVANRIARQRILRGADPPRMDFVIDQLVIEKLSVLGMEDQLVHLAGICDRPMVSVRIIPSTRGTHRGLLGPFIHVELPEGEDCVYLEDPRGVGSRLHMCKPELAAEYLSRFFELRQLGVDYGAL